MSKVQPLTFANRLLNLLTLERPDPIHYPLHEHGVSVSRTNLMNFHQNLNGLYKCIGKTSEFISYREFQSEVMLFISDFAKRGAKLSSGQITAFISSIIARPIAEYDIFADLAGVTVWPSKTPIRLGKFSVFSREVHNDELLRLIPSHRASIEFDASQSSHLLHVRLRAVDIASARDAADMQFSRFEKVISFIYNNRAYGSGLRISAQKTAGVSVRRLYISSLTGQLLVSERVAGGAIIPLQDSYFTSSDYGHDYIWEILSSTNITEFQNRLIIAIEWLGEAMLDPSSSGKLLKSAIGLEALLKSGRSDVTKNLSESVAQILGENIESRIAIEQKARQLYEARSYIVHGTAPTNCEAEAQELMDYCGECIARFLTVPELKALKTGDDLKALVTSMKYCAPSFTP